MAKEPSIEEAVARAQRGLDERIAVIRTLAETRQNLADVHARRAARIAQVERETAAEVAEAERADTVEYDRAITAGWTAAELRKIGFGEPDKKARVRKRAAAAKPKLAPAVAADDSATNVAESQEEQLSA
ncbi:hypothetical protein LQ757_18965 [Agromyces sp. SYSU K20354]|uniref:hypothetical protein n=1 Tax=Agromyces cavernae TaxID=2898659 RepID=UPI001E54EFF6|nr:hypothetical protein [Agromyces cavernae]MCD2444367.1 hypothetical protein [Agromyces cavernae]